MRSKTMQKKDDSTKKLKIAMLGHKRIPSRAGGVEVVVEQLAVRMAAQGHAVTCYNRRGRCAGEKKQTKYRGVRLKSIFTIEGKGLSAVSSSFCAAACAAFGDYDVVHFHAEGPCAMLWLPKLFGKRCIATIHGLDWQRKKWKGSFAAPYIRFGEKEAAKAADEIIVLSAGMKAYFKAAYGRETSFIPNGVSRPSLHSAELIQKKWGLEKNGYLLFLGRLVPEKGLRYLINAFKGVKTEKRLVIAGAASDTDHFVAELQELAARDKRILFTGFVEGLALAELYSNAYLYTLPSDLEGMPLSLLEAMSYGNCCVVSDIAECTEVVEDKAAVFQKGNETDLRQKLQELCDNREKVQKYQQQAADFICGKYNWDDVTEQTLNLYRKGSCPKSAKGGRVSYNESAADQ